MNTKIKLIFSSWMLIVFAIIFYSCKDNIVENPVTPGDLPVRTVTNLPANADSSGRFTYFRFRDSSTVTGADTTTANWDIAFRNTTIIINGGAVRYGNGGAIVYTSTFDTISVVPDIGFAVDTSATQLAIKGGAGNGWYNYDFATNTVTPILTRNLLIRTADGKYAKVEILSYYLNSDPEPPINPENYRYYTFKFVYQPDGSKKIK